MKTICRDCVFTEWHGNKQADCKLGRLFKFEDDGAVLNLVKDQGKEYAEILDRFCNTCRNEEALKDVPPSEWVSHVRQEVTIPVAMTVYLDNDDDANKAFQSLASIVNQTVKPQEVILIYNIEGYNENIVPFQYVDWFFQNCKDIKFRIQIIRESADYEKSIDLTIQAKEMSAIAYTVCKAGFIYNDNYVEVIDKAVNDDMKRFVALTPDLDGNGLFVFRNLHQILQGNKEAGGCKNIIEKINQIAAEEKTEHMVKSFDDLIS